MKKLLIGLLALGSISAFAQQDVKFDAWIAQRNDESVARRELNKNTEISYDQCAFTLVTEDESNSTTLYLSNTIRPVTSYTQTDNHFTKISDKNCLKIAAMFELIVGGNLNGKEVDAIKVDYKKK